MSSKVGGGIALSEGFDCCASVELFLLTILYNVRRGHALARSLLGKGSRR